MDLCFPGSAAITGPKAVSGLERDSLTVQCQYGPGWELYVKWWCRGADWDSCKFVVKTTGSEQEVKKDRVSIKDNQKNRSFTVTMEKLRLNDADTYWCGIERAGTDLGVQVEVTVDPEGTVTWSGAPLRPPDPEDSTEHAQEQGQLQEDQEQEVGAAQWGPVGGTE
ncbi:hypothetical protein CB1_000424001 [Camelus ferus]|nr:hypothetical protein CB1_000424001 [Camelus ferus]